MNSDELTHFLSKSLVDRKLTRSEKSALADWLAAHVTTDQHRGLVRHAAFEVARQNITDLAAAEVVEWLEDVMKVMAPIAVEPHGATAPRLEGSQAFFSPGDACLDQIIHRFRNCRRTADVCVFTITDDRISRAILDAHQRRVAIRIITDSEKQYDRGSDIHRLREAGVLVKFGEELAGSEPGSNGHMHHKFAIFDGQCLVCGSYNWTRGAANLNFEDLLETGDATAVGAFATEFARLWNRF